MKIKIKKPKIKISAPKAVTKAISTVTKPVETLAKGAIKSTGNIASSALKGDIKGVAGGALGAVQSIKDAAKQAATGTLGMGTGALGAVGSLTGAKEISDVAKNINREGSKGVNTYGDAGMDIGANLATSGAYGGIKAGVEALSDKGLKGLLSGKMLTQAALSAADSTGVLAPGQLEAIKSGMSAAQAASKGDIKSLALQGLGSYGGLKPEELAMARTGVAAATGDKAGVASGLASQYGAGEDTAKLVGALAGGKDLKSAALNKLGSMAGFDPKQIQMGLSAVTGDKAGLASSLASQFGAGSTTSGIIGNFAGGKGAREVISDQAGAYAGDAANQMLDAQMGRAGLSREGIKEIEQRVNDIKRIPASLKEAAQSQYQIAKGDTFNAIAKKMGVSPEQLKAANPNIKDINKIAAGLNINVPGASGSSSTEPGVVESGQMSEQDFIEQRNYGTQDLSGPIGEGMVESGQMNQGQFDANQAYQDWENSQQGYIGKEKKAAMQKLYQDRASNRISADEFAVGQTNIDQGNENEPGFLDKMKSFVGGNKGLLQGAAEVAGAVGGYAAAESARKEQKELAEKQLKDVQGLGGQFAGMQYDPERYKQEREFLQQRVAGGGITAQERKIQQEGDVRAARAAAAQRLSGMEQQARLGGSAVGTSALAAALSGAQAGQNIQAESNLAREASASQRLEQDIQRQGQLSSKQTSEEAELAKQQSEFGLNKTRQVGEEREELSKLAQARGKAAAELAGALSDTAVGALERTQSPEQEAQAAQKKAQADQDRQYQDQQRQMQLESQRMDLEAKRKAAQDLSMRGTTPQQQPKPATQQPTRPAAQPATGGYGEGLGVLQSSMGQAGNVAQKASDIFNKFNQNIPKQAQPAAQQIQKGIQQGQQAVQQGQKVVQQVQQGVDKAKKIASQFKSNPFGKLFG
jgi:LysM repeat protein